MERAEPVALSAEEAMALLEGKPELSPEPPEEIGPEDVARLLGEPREAK